jgi:DNA-binding response OmpR family regulator
MSGAQPNGHIVYIVDDERVIAETLSMILGQAGYTSIAFEHPLLALAAAEEVPPHLLITDVMMPELSGVDLAIQFRKSFPECRVLLFSGKAATADLLEEARSRGYEFELLSKPVHPSDLLAKVESLSANPMASEASCSEMISRVVHHFDVRSAKSAISLTLSRLMPRNFPPCSLM